MNIDKLNFVQLHKLISPVNLMRVERVYHGALHRAWTATGTKEFFTVGSASHRFPDIKRRYTPVLDLIRSPATDKRLYKLAVTQSVPCFPSWGTEFYRVCIRDYISQGYGAEKYARCMADLMAAHCAACSIPCRIDAQSEGFSRSFVVLAGTNDIGIAILLRKPGLPWAEIVRLCWAHGCQPRVFFHWLPVDFEDRHNLNYFGGYVNPALRPVQTPDVQKTINHIVTKNESVEAPQTSVG